MKLHGTAAFLSAALLFLVQPMLAKMALPSLGGSPSTWIAAALLFQALLLLGYLWAHLLVRLRPPLQLGLHTVLLLAGALTLPPVISVAEPSLPPLLASVGLLSREGALPFLGLAATAPLLGRWYAATAPGRDPYVLYAAGNAGSLLGLLSYPFLVEPTLPLSEGLGSQARLWALLYGVSAGLVLACGWRRLRAPVGVEAAPSRATTPWRTRAWWAALAFLPVSVQLGAAQYLTTDIAAGPLLWVLPLAVYLLTFVVAFSPGGGRVPLRPVDLVLGATALAAFAPVWLGFKLPGWLLIGAHLVIVGAAGLAAHLRLAAARPEPSRLTGFYLTMAAGGLAAGAAHSLLFPLVFASVLEYPLVLAGAMLLRPSRRDSSRRGLVLDLLFPLQLAGAVVLLELLGQRGFWSFTRTELAIEAALVALAMLLFLRRPLRFAFGFLLFLALSRSVLFTGQTTLHQARTFFGVHRVARVQPPPEEVEGRLLERKPYHLLIHGTTRHGAQYPDPRLRRFPTAYYHPSGPGGEIFAVLEGDSRLRRVGIVGLGTGTLAAYGAPDRYFSFYELDPEVVRIAKDPRLFTYLAEAPGPVDVTVGDGRLALAEARDGEFGLLVLDAFSSDAIPVHLLTREALALYLRKLQPGGLLAFHVSNHYLDLPPVLSAVADTLGITGRVRRDAVDSQIELFELKSDSTWVVLGRSETDLPPLEGWRSLPAPEPRHLWTDQRSSLLPLLKWRKG